MRAAVVLTAFLAVLAGAAPASAGVSPLTPAEAGAIGQEAFLYGYPLLEFMRVRKTATSVRCPDARGNSPANSLSNARALRHACQPERSLAPNVDTLYSIAHL